MFFSAAAFALSTLAAQATTVTSADFIVADGGTDLSRNTTQNDDVQVFAEQTGVTVTEGEVTVDYLASALTADAETFGISSLLAGTPLGAGTYDSFLVHFDPDGGGSIADVVIDFGADIVALIVSNTGGGTTLLNTSDAIFGAGGTYDTHLGRRTEDNDSFSISGSELTLISLTTNANHIDNIRVLTEVAAVPLPASLPLMLAGLGGVAALRRRQK